MLQDVRQAWCITEWADYEVETLLHLADLDQISDREQNPEPCGVAGR